MLSTNREHYVRAQKYVNNGDIDMIPVVIPPEPILTELLRLFDHAWAVMEENLYEINYLGLLQEQITFKVSGC